MMVDDFRDVELQRPAAEPEAPPPSRSALWPWVAGGVLLGAVICAVYVVWDRDKRPRPVAETEVATGRTAQQPSAAAENIEVPPLDQTDPLVRRLLGALSTHPQVAAWLATDNLIRNFVAVVEDIAGGATPAKHVKALAPAGAFSVVRREGELHADPRSYARYDALAAAVASIDAAGAARIYATLKPRIDEAYRERGFVEGSFDRTLEQAIGRLLDTPVPADEAALAPRVTGYRFADPDLESLSGAQKQLLRMGPRNARIIQDKLREVQAALRSSGR